jgi:hypothetical protein
MRKLWPCAVVHRALPQYPSCHKGHTSYWCCQRLSVNMCVHIAAQVGLGSLQGHRAQLFICIRFNQQPSGLINFSIAHMFQGTAPTFATRALQFATDRVHGMPRHDSRQGASYGHTCKTIPLQQ